MKKYPSDNAILIGILTLVLLTITSFYLLGFSHGYNKKQREVIKEIYKMAQGH